MDQVPAAGTTPKPKSAFATDAKVEDAAECKCAGLGLRQLRQLVRDMIHEEAQDRERERDRDREDEGRRKRCRSPERKEEVLKKRYGSAYVPPQHRTSSYAASQHCAPQSVPPIVEALLCRLLQSPQQMPQLGPVPAFVAGAQPQQPAQYYHQSVAANPSQWTANVQRSGDGCSCHHLDLPAIAPNIEPCPGNTFTSKTTLLPLMHHHQQGIAANLVQ